MTNLEAKFGRKIKGLRKEKGMTQEDLAYKADISVDFLSLIERGKSAPSFKNLEKIARALEANVQELFNF